MKKYPSASGATLAIGLALLLPSGAHPQSTPNPIPQIELKAGEKIPVANFPGTFAAIGPIRCDAEGNVYMRPFLPKGHPLLAPIARISADGQRITKVDVPDLPELQAGAEFQISDFAIARDGTVLELGWIATKNKNSFLAVIQIAADNSATLTRIDSQMSPTLLAAMPSGMFLLSGVLHSTEMFGKDVRQSSRPLTAIFDSRGVLLKEIELPGDVKIPDFDSRKKEQPAPGSLVPGVTELAVAEDGTIYLVRDAPKPKIWVISSTGEVMRSFELVKPAVDILPMMFYAAGRLAFSFHLPDPKDDSRTSLVARIVDPLDGRILWDYVGTDDANGMPVCYSGQEFTILSGATGGGSALQKLSAR